MKKCTFCAEEIQDEAIKCKHCGEKLNVPSVEVAVTGPVHDELGVIMIIIPFLACFAVRFWVGQMSLMQFPSPKLRLLFVGTILITAVLAAIEGSKMGMGNSSDLTKFGKRNSGPIVWFFLVAVFWFIAYPYYFVARKKYGLKNYFSVSMLVVILFVVSFYTVNIAIEKRAYEVQQQFQSGDAIAATNIGRKGIFD